MYRQIDIHTGTYTYTYISTYTEQDTDIWAFTLTYILTHSIV